MACLAVQVSGWLVSQEERWFVGQSAGDGDALLFAAGELGRIVMLAVGKSDFDEESVSSPRCVARAGNLHRDKHVFQRSQRREQMKKLKDEADALATETREGVFVESRDVHSVEDDASFRRRIEPRQEPEQRGLPAAGRTGDCQDASRRNREVEWVQDRQRAAAARHALADAAKLDHDTAI